MRNRNNRGQFVKGCKKTLNWYISIRTGANHPMWKGGRKKEIIKCACGCEKKLNKYDKKNRLRKFIQGHQNTKHWLGKKRPELTKNYNPNWKGGVSSGDYKQRRIFRRQIQKKVFERDDYTCQICGQRGGDLQVDHIQSWSEYVELRFNIDNCRTLCVYCHYMVTFGKPMPPKVRAWGHNFLKAEI